MVFDIATLLADEYVFSIILGEVVCPMLSWADICAFSMTCRSARRALASQLCLIKSITRMIHIYPLVPLYKQRVIVPRKEVTMDEFNPDALLRFLCTFIRSVEKILFMSELLPDVFAGIAHVAMKRQAVAKLPAPKVIISQDAARREVCARRLCDGLTADVGTYGYRPRLHSISLCMLHVSKFMNMSSLCKNILRMRRGLRTVQLWSLTITPDCFDVFMKMIIHMGPTLEALELVSSNFDDRHLRMCSFVEGVQKLRSFHMKAAALECSNTVASVFRALAPSPRLKELSMDSSFIMQKLPVEDWLSFCKQAGSRLKVLNLSAVSLHFSFDHTRVCDGLASMVHLQTLVLDNNPSIVDLSPFVQKAAPSMRALRNLSLRNCKLRHLSKRISGEGRGGLVSGVVALQRMLNNLHTLDLSGNRLTHTSMQAFEKALHWNTSMRKLNLANNDLSDSGFLVERVIANANALEHLDVSFNPRLTKLNNVRPLIERIAESRHCFILKYSSRLCDGSTIVKRIVARGQ